MNAGRDNSCPECAETLVELERLCSRFAVSVRRVQQTIDSGVDTTEHLVLRDYLEQGRLACELGRVAVEKHRATHVPARAATLSRKSRMASGELPSGPSIIVVTPCRI